MGEGQCFADAQRSDIPACAGVIFGADAPNDITLRAVIYLLHKCCGGSATPHYYSGKSLALLPQELRRAKGGSYERKSLKRLYGLGSRRKYGAAKAFL